MSRHALRTHIARYREIPNPVQPSWWADSGPSRFTARAEQEYPRMRSSRFAVVALRVTEGPSGPSTLDVYRSQKRLRGAA